MLGAYAEDDLNVVSVGMTPGLMMGIALVAIGALVLIFRRPWAKLVARMAEVFRSPSRGAPVEEIARVQSISAAVFCLVGGILIVGSILGITLPG